MFLRACSYEPGPTISFVKIPMCSYENRASPVNRDVGLGDRDLGWPSSYDPGYEHSSPVDWDENVSTVQDWTVV